MTVTKTLPNMNELPREDNVTREFADFIDIEGVGDDITDLQNDIDLQMNKIFAEFGGDTNDTHFKINVKRIMPGKGELEHCFSCLPHELPIMDRIKDNFGAGEYEIWIYKNSKIFRRRKINIAKEIEKKDPLMVQQQPPAGDIATLMRVLTENQQSQFAQMQQLITQQTSRPQLDITGILAAAVPVIGLVKEFIPKKQDEMGAFMKAAEFMQGIQGGDKEGNIFDLVGGLAKTFAPPLIEAAMTQQPSNINQQENIQITERSQVKNPTVLEKNVNAGLQAQTNADNIMRGHLQTLCGLAVTNADPGVYADVIMDRLSPAQLNSLTQHPDLMGYFKGLLPAVEHHELWFTALFNEIRAVQNEGNDIEHGVDTAPEPVNITDIDTGNMQPAQTEQSDNANTPTGTTTSADTATK